MGPLPDSPFQRSELISSWVERPLPDDATSQERAIVGAMLGTALGDSIGLPYEGLSPQRARRLFPSPLRQRLLIGHGMISDDTEHTALVVEALVTSGNSADLFAREFASRLRRWFLCGPAGIGFATLRACLKLCLGMSPRRSGVYSAGNGPAMRSAILGATIDDIDQLREFVKVSTCVTHTDPRAEFGALAVALAARAARQSTPPEPIEFVHAVRMISAENGADELIDILALAAMSVAAGQTTADFAAAQGMARGVSGYVNYTVPIALHAVWRYPRDFKRAITAVVECGGDTDTTAAIVGGIVGTAVGKEGLPVEWLDRLQDWPRSVRWLDGLAQSLAQTKTGAASGQRLAKLPVSGVLARNGVFAGGDHFTWLASIGSALLAIALNSRTRRMRRWRYKPLLGKLCRPSKLSGLAARNSHGSNGYDDDIATVRSADARKSAATAALSWRLAISYQLCPRSFDPIRSLARRDVLRWRRCAAGS